MARVCMLSGRGTKAGNNRSHSMRQTKRTFKVNLIKKKVIVDGLPVTIKISSKMYKKYYVWSTNNLDRRLHEHRISWYSAKRIWDWKCIWYFVCKSKEEARTLERNIKKSCHPERCIAREDFIQHNNLVADFE
jgi:large subunit ribosomal protein L28